jgi:hypothetical protein
VLIDITTSQIVVLRSSCKVPDSSVRRYKIPILSEDFRTSSDIKFHKNPSSADRHDEANRRFSKLLHAPIHDRYYISGAERRAVVTALTQHLTLRTARPDSATNHSHIDYAAFFHIIIFKTEKKMAGAIIFSLSFSHNSMRLVCLLLSASCIVCTSLIILMHAHTCCVCVKKHQVEVIPSVLCFYTQQNKTQGAGTTCRPIEKCLALLLTVSNRLQTHFDLLLHYRASLLSRTWHFTVPQTCLVTLKPNPFKYLIFVFTQVPVCHCRLSQLSVLNVATPTWLAKPQLVLDSKQTGTTARMPRIQN